MRRFTLGLLLLAVLSAGLGHTVFAAESVKVRTGRHEGYHRLVLEWAKPVGHRLARDGDIVTLTFDRAFDADLAAIEAGLRGIVANVAEAPDGRTLGLTLARDVGVRSFATGTRVVVDLYTDPNAAPPIAQGATAAPKVIRVPVRANEEKGRLRVVLDWPQSVDYDLVVEGRIATLRVARPAILDLATVMRRAMTLARDFETGVDDRGTWLRFDIAEGSELEHFPTSTKIVIDVSAGSAPAVAATAPLPALPPLPTWRRLEPSTGATVASLAPRRPSPSEVHPFPREAEPAARDDRAPRSIAVAGIGNIYAPMLARLTMQDGVGVLRFIVNRPVGAAAMIRDGRFVLAFDGRFDVAVVRAVSGPDVPCADLRQIERDAGTVLSCAVPEGSGAEMVRDGTVWEVRLTSDAAAPKRTLTLDQAEPGRAHVASEGAGTPFEVAGGGGRRLVFVPLGESGEAWPEDRWLSRYLLMATSQGIILEIEGLGITVASGPAGVDIVTDAIQAGTMADGLIDPRGWPTDLNPNLVEKELALEPSPENRLAKRVVLAQWYLSQGLTVDASGQLGLVAAELPAAMAGPDLRALLGAVLTRMGRLDKAGELLDDPVLNGTHVELWRAVLDSLRGRYADSAGRYRMTSDAWIRMNEPLRSWIGIALANGLALGGNPIEAQSVLGLLKASIGEQSGSYAKAWGTLVAGNILAASGQLEEAEASWRAAAESDDRLARAEARATLVDHLLAAGRLTPEEAIHELELLSFAWRGDYRERIRTAQLVDLYRQTGQIRAALRAMRSMVVTYPDASGTPAITEDMAALFREAMIGETAHFLGPLESLALFYEFEELAPVGDDGDVLVETLAERLAAVDLVDRAGDLLVARLDGDLVGPDRARIGARLAELRLASDRYQDALDALATSGSKQADAAVLAHRRLSQAQALMALGHETETLALLSGVAGPDAARLRADIHWARGDWPLAAAELERVVAAPPAPRDEAAPGRVSDDALRLALAYALAGDGVGVARTRAKFSPAIAEDDPRRGVFDLLTKGEGRRPDEWSTLPATIADVATFEAFLATYRAPAATEIN